MREIVQSEVKAKAERLSLRIEKERLSKLRQYSKQKKKSMTQLIENWIDKLKLNKEDTRD